jgi:hypothetical protein
MAGAIRIHGGVAGGRSAAPKRSEMFCAHRDRRHGFSCGGRSPLKPENGLNGPPARSDERGSRRRHAQALGFDGEVDGLQERVGGGLGCGLRGGGPVTEGEEADLFHAGSVYWGEIIGTEVRLCRGRELDRRRRYVRVAGNLSNDLSMSDSAIWHSSKNYN